MQNCAIEEWAIKYRVAAVIRDIGESLATLGSSGAELHEALDDARRIGLADEWAGAAEKAEAVR